jgi:hypothetical protein
MFMTGKILGLLALGLTISIAAKAETETLYYSGNEVTDVTGLPVTVSGSINGYLTLDAPLGANLSGAEVTPVAFSFNGGDPLSNLNSSALGNFFFSTDTSSHITDWIFALTGTTADGTTISEGSVFFPASDGNPATAEDVIQLNDSTGISTSAGTWTVASVAAPEIDPTSAVSGLMLLLGSVAVLRGRTKAASVRG